jgi:hypothetical protein
MEPSAMQALITSLQVHRLGLTSLLSPKSVKRPSGTREEMAMSSGRGGRTDTSGGSAEELGWLLAMQAQSCAYLALELQKFAEELSTSRITCPESTYKRLYFSIEIFTRLLDSMRQSYAESNSHEIENSIPVLSERLVAEIHSMWARGQVTTTGESTTSTEKVSQTTSRECGDTK